MSTSVARAARLALLLALVGSSAQADRVKLLESHDEAWRARVALISGAQETLEMEYYAVHPGAVADSLAGLVVEAADRGVQVRVIFDAFGNGMDDHVLAWLVAHPRVDVRHYHPFNPFQPGEWQRRLHDKILLADGRLLISGGRNIGDKYYGREGVKKLSLDRDILIEGTPGGPNVPAEVQAYFDTLWNSDHIGEVSVRAPRKECLKRHGSACKVVPPGSKERRADAEIRAHLREERRTEPEWFDGGAVLSDRMHEAERIWFLHNAIAHDDSQQVGTGIRKATGLAETYVLAQSPYVIPDDLEFETTRRQSGRGVSLEIITNSVARSPNVLAISGYERYKQRMLDAGVRFWEYQGEDSLHYKSLVIDDRYAMVGSYNLDPRSANLNTEMMFIVDSPSFTAELKRWMEKHRSKAVAIGEDGQPVPGQDVELAPVSIGRRMTVGILTFLAPLFRPLL